MPEDKNPTEQEIKDTTKTEELIKFLKMLRTPEAARIIEATVVTGFNNGGPIRKLIRGESSQGQYGYKADDLSVDAGIIKGQAS